MKRLVALMFVLMTWVLNVPFAHAQDGTGGGGGGGETGTAGGAGGTVKPSGSGGDEEKVQYGEHVTPVFIISGDGAILAPNANVGETAAAVGAGLGYESTRYVVDVSVKKGTTQKVGPTQDGDGTIEVFDRAGYGFPILEPGIGDVSMRLRLAVYPFSVGNGISSKLYSRVGPSVNVSSATFEFAFPDSTSHLSSVKVTPLAASFCGSYIARGTAKENVIMVEGELCPVGFRVIGGNIGADPDLRAKILGSSQNVYFGFESALRLRFGNVSIGANLSFFFGDLPGLTSLQFAPTIGLKAPISIPID